MTRVWDGKINDGPQHAQGFELKPTHFLTRCGDSPSDFATRVAGLSDAYQNAELDRQRKARAARAYGHLRELV